MYSRLVPALISAGALVGGLAYDLAPPLVPHTDTLHPAWLAGIRKSTMACPRGVPWIHAFANGLLLNGETPVLLQRSALYSNRQYPRKSHGTGHGFGRIVSSGQSLDILYQNVGQHQSDKAAAEEKLSIFTHNVTPY